MSRLVLRLLVCLLPLGLALPLASTSARAPVHPIVGIGDNKPDFFGDPRFLALGIRHVRYDVSWDALSVPDQRATTTRWMNLARAHGLKVLITIDHSKRVIYRRVPGQNKPKKFSQSRVLPTAAEYVKAFKAFRARFPWVTEFATWDETNYYGEATYNQVALVAAYYKGMRAACPRCTILAAEFLDVPKHQAVPMASWAKQFIKYAGEQPKYWGLNNYVEANHLVSSSTRQLLATVRGNIWLAETGGIVYRALHKHPDFPQNAAHAAVVDRYLLNTVGSLSSRIQRIYLYEWNAATPTDGWDTALISSAGATREGYVVLARTLFSWGIRPDCAISRVPPTCTGIGAGGRPVQVHPGGPTGPSGASGATGSSGATGTGATGGTAAP